MVDSEAGRRRVAAPEEVPALIEQHVLDPIRAQIARYAGGLARVWFYTVSHRQLHIRLSATDMCGDDCVYLVCHGCVDIAGPFDWEPTHVAISQNPSGKGYLVTDARAGFRLRCSVIFVADSRTPGFQPGKQW